MARNVFYLVSENYQLIENMKSFCHTQGVTCEVYSPAEWERKMNGQMQSQLPTPLTVGQSPVQVNSHQHTHNTGATVIPFPSNPAEYRANQMANRVQTINELESVAIETAIMEFNGNLTEAAKALGIGRATLYRKVKQYNIDPSVARRKRVA